METRMNTLKILEDIFIFTLVGCLKFLLVHLEMPSSQYWSPLKGTEGICSSLLSSWRAPLFYVEVMTSLFHNIQEGGSSGSQLFGIILAPKRMSYVASSCSFLSQTQKYLRVDNPRWGSSIWFSSQNNIQDWTISDVAPIFICFKNLPNLRRKILSKVSYEGLVGKSI